MTPTRQLTGEAEGFHGSVAGLSLPDVIQLNGQNRFSGCITVQYGDSVGRIFFREGNVIHSEQGGRSGEEAFYDIMDWRTGSFSLEPNVSTTSHTIHMNSQHLLIEAHRVLDERRAGRASSPAAPHDSPQPRPANAVGGVLDRLKAIPGVTYAVLLTKDGLCVEDASGEAENLAGKAAYLALIASRLGDSLRAGALRAAVIHGATEHCLLLAARDHYLSLLLDGAADIASVEASVRKLFAPAHSAAPHGL